MPKNRVQNNIKKFKVDYNQIYPLEAKREVHRICKLAAYGFLGLSVVILLYLVVVYSKNSQIFTEKYLLSLIGLSLFFLCLILSIVFYTYEKLKMNHYTIKQIAFLNAKSEIGNWNYLKERVHVIREAQNEQKYAFVLMNVNNFNLISGATNYLFEKRILNIIGDLLMKSIDEDETCANLTADYFCLYLHFQHNQDLLSRLKIITEDLISECSQEMNCAYLMSFAGGIVTEAQNSDLMFLCRQADMARQSAMSDNETKFVLYNDILQHEILERYELALQLQNAMANHEFELYYQPIFHILGKHVDKCEAFIRWNHPSKGLLTPEIFLSQFEDTGFILELDMFVIESVMRQIKKLEKKGIYNVVHTINLSLLNFRNNQIVKNLAAYLEQYEINPSMIEIEISTNNQALDMNKIVPVLFEIRNLGIKIIIDDYGNDHSLELLCCGAIDGIKFNETFTHRLIFDTRAEVVFEKIIELGRAMNLMISAEGIETRGQLDAIIRLGIKLGQGNFLMKVMNAKKFEKYVLKTNEK